MRRGYVDVEWINREKRSSTKGGQQPFNTDNRNILFDSFNWLPSNINIDVKLLTKGSDFLTYQENTTIFKHAFKYIKDSKRFNFTQKRTEFSNLVETYFYLLNITNRDRTQVFPTYEVFSRI
jgi:hypothetical protein